MMYEVMIRFKIVRNNEYLEVCLDSRLSFKDNLKILSELIDMDLKDMNIYDPIKKMFLDKETPIAEFNINYFISLQLF